MPRLAESKVNELVKKAHDAKNNSYSPYSHFRVGACLLTEDGTEYTGCNVENAAYGLCICAERTAMVKAVSEGHKKFQAIFISGDLEEDFIRPCGSCRQFLAEFGLEYEVYTTKPDLTYECHLVKEFLPFGFSPADLTAKKAQ